MKKVLRTAAVAVGLFSLINSFAQPGCPSVNAGSDVRLSCGQTCTTLHASVFAGNTTASYSVDSIPYNPPFPFNSGIPILVNLDDAWSDTVNLPFNFTFFGRVYNKILVGSNGMISFDLNNANGANSWQIQGPIPANYWGDIRNTIMGPWQDIDPTNMGHTYYQISGNYPCRSFEVTWDSIPYYGDSNSMYTVFNPDSTVRCPVGYASQQIVIYEISNTIEIYIKNKDVCPGWNPSVTGTGVAIEGIQNGDQFTPATVAYTVPGRNATVWTAQNDAWRFTPSGTTNTSVSWYDGATLISNTDSVTVCTTTPHTYTAQAIYSNSDGTTTTVVDDVNVTLSGLFTQIDSVRQPTCPGSTNGAIYASFTVLDTGAIGYGWLPGGLGITSVTNVGAGTYVFIVTDSALCIHVDTVVLTNASNPSFNAPVITNVSCNGGNNGSIVVSVDSAATPIVYNWSGGLANNDTVSSLIANTYSVTATDSLGCSVSASYNVTEPSAITLGSPTITQQTCTAGGTISVTASGGTGTLVYNWSNGDTGSLADSLSAGPYTLTVTDQNLCSITASYNVTSASALSLGTPTIINILCNGGSTGSITANATGTGTITYLWSTGATTATISNLVVGCYSVTASDTNGCSASATYCVTEPTAIVAGTPVVTQATCQVGGSIQMNSSGGTGALVYNWSNADTGAFVDSLAAGDYIVTISDANSCSLIDTINAAGNPAVVSFGQVSITNVSCNGGNNGRIVTSANGGTGTITFNWSNNRSGPIDSVLTAGPYSVTITDQVGCSASTTYVVTQPLPLSLNLSLSNPICINTTGFGSITATGGAGGYTYLWNNQSDSTGAVDLFPGPISVTVTDANGCSAVARDTIRQAPDFVPTSIVRSYPCSNPAFGTDSIVVVGGIGPFTYELLGVDTNNTGVFPNLAPGNYTWIVKDSLGCSKTSVFTILPSATNDNYTVASTDASCFGVADGTITITPLSSNNPYSYSLNGGAYQANNIFNVASGNYSIVAQNKYGCTTTLSATVNGPPADSLTVTTSPTSCFGSQYNDGSITVHTFSENGPYTFSLDGGTSQTDSTFTNVSAGTHNVVAQNNQGCSFTLAAIVDQPAQVIVNTSPDTILASPGAGNPMNVVTQNFVNPVYTWSPTEGLSCSNCNNPTATISQSTVYYVTVSEGQSNCSASDSVVIEIVAGNYKIPNAFTPNGDGKNDAFGPFQTGSVTVKEFRIYNRWGEMVYNGTGYWDGTYRGEAQPAGTYVYYIRIDVPDKTNPAVVKTENTQGSFSLLR